MHTFYNANLAFIWRDLMSARARVLATHATTYVLIGTALLVAVPYAVGFYIDGLTNQALDVILVGGILFFSLETLRIILGWLRHTTREYFFQEEFWHLAQAITRMYVNRPLSFISGGSSDIDGGGIESLRDKVWNVIGSYIFQIIPSYASMLFGLVACTYANWSLGIVAFVFISMELWFGNANNQYIHQEMRPVIDLFKRWERRMQEWWRSIDHVKSQGVEHKILRQIHDEVQDALAGDDAVWRVFFARALTWHRIRSLIFAIALYGVVGYLALNDAVSLTSGVLVFFSFERIRTVLVDINDQQRDVQFNLASIAKYRRVLTQPVPYTYNEGVSFADSEIAITFDSISHSVDDDDGKRCILHDVSLHIPSGTKVGIVGPSGAGKSQLLSLLVRASDPDKGYVRINGTPLSEMATESFLRYVAVIMQKSEPFEDSILGNVLFGVSHLDSAHLADKQQVERLATDALSKAGLDINAFPHGLRTNIGYKGLKLSGGQQQRLQIAAAHFKLSCSENRPRLILADEPTSSLDSLSESAVMEHLQDNLPTGTTLLMVAHRLSTVAHMDKIVFVRPLDVCDEHPQVTMHDSLGELYVAEALFREMADAQGFRP